MQLIEEKIKTYITTLSLLSSLNIEDFDNEDDITSYIPNCIANTVIILGNIFDEELAGLIREAKMIISELYRKNIREVETSNIFNTKKSINNIINDNMDIILNTNIYEYSYIEVENLLNSKVDDYFDRLDLSNIKIERNKLEETNNYIFELIDNTYNLSKELSNYIIEKIGYLYNYKNANLTEISFYAIDGILFLIKYYLVTFRIFRIILTYFNEENKIENDN